MIDEYKGPLFPGAERFTLIENNPAYEADARTVWYWDTARPLPEKDMQPYVAVQCYRERDPNTQIVYHQIY